jgi:hypothetical protein
VPSQAVDVVNQVLHNLGDHPLTAAQWATPTLKRAEILDAFYDDVLDATLAAHPWNFAIVRDTLYSYTEPAGTLTPGATTGSDITFTASATGTFFVAGVSDVGKRLHGDGVAGKATIDGHSSTSPAATLTPASGALTVGTTGVVFTAGSSVFVAGDIGKVITADSGVGIATITAQGGTTATCTINEAFASTSAIASGDWALTSTTVVTADITENFAATTAIATGSWRLYQVPPDWGYTDTFVVPTNALRFWRVEGSEPYQREGDYFVAYSDTINVRYIARVTDVTKWSPLFTRAFIHHLTAIVSEPITGQAGKHDRFWALYQGVLKQARTIDGLEGSTEHLTANDLIDVRSGPGSGGVISGPRGHWGYLS